MQVFEDFLEAQRQRGELTGPHLRHLAGLAAVALDFMGEDVSQRLQGGPHVPTPTGRDQIRELGRFDFVCHGVTVWVLSTPRIAVVRARNAGRCVRSTARTR